ncbi:dihydroneopterin aldolase [uncultured Selenomonas sp.]|uniref:dihydroneopterin aldolase n=1 Tax=uncultured Selenomonas sp. TaxID=159275 RepID=UPI0028E4E94D|nr:dihydroneopterin aldolase [uncultured Selenomonas sp.]
MDRIFLRGMRFMACHGVLPHEQEVSQPFEVDVELGLSLRTAGESDDLDDTVNYAKVYRTVSSIMNGASKQLIESLAEELAEDLLWQFSPLRWVRVTVHKPTAPIDGIFSDVGVMILRRRKDLVC